MGQARGHDPTGLALATEAQRQIRRRHPVHDHRHLRRREAIEDHLELIEAIEVEPLEAMTSLLMRIA